MNPSSSELRQRNVFRVLVSGCFSEQQTKITWRPEKRLIARALGEEIEAYWGYEMNRQPAQPFLFNGQLCRLDAWQHNDKELEIVLGLTDYKELLYSNFRTAKIVAKYGAEALSKALGISAVLFSRDDDLMLIRRSETVGECPGMLDVFGGHIGPYEHSVDNIPNPFLAIRAELVEECGLELSKNDMIICLGLIETTLTQKPEMIFYLRSHKNSREILAGASDARSIEIAEIQFVPRVKLASFISENELSVSPSAQGALCLLQQHDHN